jgi:hypothetical protein
MYTPHPSQELTELFSRKPFQGAAPQTATFLFIGLDANYDPRIATSPVFPHVRAYHNDGSPSGGHMGSTIRFFFRATPATVGCITATSVASASNRSTRLSSRLLELLHIPTVGRNVLAAEDLHEKQGLRISGSRTSGIRGRRGIARPGRAAMSSKTRAAGSHA